MTVASPGFKFQTAWAQSAPGKACLANRHPSASLGAYPVGGGFGTLLRRGPLTAVAELCWEPTLWRWQGRVCTGVGQALQKAAPGNMNWEHPLAESAADFAIASDHPFAHNWTVRATVLFRSVIIKLALSSATISPIYKPRATFSL